MASNVLPLATLKVVQNPNQCYHMKLGLSTHARIGCFSIGYRGLSPALRVSSSSSVVRNFNSIISVPKKPSFVVRAESNENLEETLSVAVQDVSEAETEGKSEEPKQPRVKLGEIMGILNRRAIEAANKERPTPDLRTGDIVEIKWAVPENKRRFSIYRGIVISKQNAGIHTTIRIRRIIAGIGVEIVFPIYSPSLKEIRVVNHRKVRRARLYYLRDKLPRFSSFKW